MAFVLHFDTICISLRKTYDYGTDSNNYQNGRRIEGRI